MRPQWALTAAERQLLPAGRRRGPTRGLIAIMMFVMVIVAAAGLAIGNAAALLSQATEARYSIQLPGGAGQGDALARAARDLDGVRSARAVPEEEVNETLDRWLGPAAREADLPVPALVEVEFDDNADAKAIETALRSEFADAMLVANRSTIQPLLRSLRALGWVAASLVILVGVAAGAAVVLAARAALAANRDTIDVMHGVGATDEQVVRLFQYRIALDSLVGGALGAGLAALVLLLVSASGLAIAGRMAGQALLFPVDLLMLALLPLGGALLATLVARRAVLVSLRALP
ncbi:cell division protein FtsX [Sphingomicrobium lutaoense]|uniref:Cell division transport system permease protein n=1 Tax=Sphingomicrobium lutaoense TaxID=515949 RepID=A0A839Z2G6_9SPHN|nr:FtsX-like permease family protein [Sphingomicrobium lutaoense]MBB3764820.1 cell division transport system permease protein [Sphingomicrobium lutaoense]